MPEDGVCKKCHEEMLTEEEMIQAVKAAVSLGIKKVRITGGEPLVKKNIVSICKQVAELPEIEDLCITTNATLLPKFAKELREAGVNRVNISLDTLNPEKYHQITRIGDLKDALDGIEAALKAGFEKIKINAVLIGGFNDDEIRDMAELTKKYPVDVRFIELMPMYDSGDYGPDAYVPYTAVLEALPELEPIAGFDGVAKTYRFPDGKGKVGLISPVNAHFCAKCNRLRLTADGKLKPCLHSEDEIAIKGLDFDGMVEGMKEAILAKPQCHETLSYYKRSKSKRDMNRIGG
jgi:cyclic pyranopterin phosphate synthase